MPHPGQSRNVVIYMHTSVSVVLTSNTIHDREDVSSIFPIARFSLPDLIFHARHIRARFELPRAWFPSLQFIKILNFKARRSDSGWSEMSLPLFYCTPCHKRVSISIHLHSLLVKFDIQNINLAGILDFSEQTL